MNESSKWGCILQVLLQIGHISLTVLKLLHSKLPLFHSRHAEADHAQQAQAHLRQNCGRE
jgi:hypothetical protein